MDTWNGSENAKIISHVEENKANLNKNHRRYKTT